MDPSVRRICCYVEDTLSAAGRRAEPPLRKVAVLAVVQNPFAERAFEPDLSELMELGARLGGALGERALDLLEAEAESHGKAAVVGTAGEQEHALALKSSRFGDAWRATIGASTWMPSVSKRAVPGDTVDVPLAHKRELRVGASWDAMTVHLADAPQAGELVLIAAVASRGRLDARTGGLDAEDIT